MQFHVLRSIPLEKHIQRNIFDHESRLKTAHMCFQKSVTAIISCGAVTNELSAQ